MKFKKNVSGELIKIEESNRSNSEIGKEIEKLLVELKKNVQAGKSMDTESFKNNTDGELLAMILNSFFQSALLGLKDRKGFKKNLRI